MNALPGDFLAETFLRYLSPYRRSHCASNKDAEWFAEGYAGHG
jgi:hypothetical protein